jgi:serine/threonine-protein kinase
MTTGIVTVLRSSNYYTPQTIIFTSTRADYSETGNLLLGLTVAVLYCYACNHHFDGDISCCPRCGLAVPDCDDASHRDTVIAIDLHAPVPAPTDVELPLKPGESLGIYQCQKLLGRGGMGVVYLARNTSLQRLCALKILSPRHSAADEEYVQRFENEGRASAALVHPNVVTTHASGRTGSLYFLEMEYVSGGSLQAEIDTHGPIGPIRSTQMAVGIARGLAEAHNRGFIHRDLKPDNVLVTPGGTPKISDFGLAKRVLSDDLPGRKLVGTPYFMAPELFDGGEATSASDVYALGVCYYLMLTGRLPFEGRSISDVMRAILTSTAPSPRRIDPNIPLDMAECSTLLMNRDPDQRPQDARLAYQRLQAVLGSTSDLDNLVYDAFNGVPGVTWRETSDGRFKVHLQLRNSRSQTVYIENSSHPAGERLLLIYSICCEASPSFYEQALRLNAGMNHGAISIRDIEGKPYFVMIDTYPRGTVSGEDIRRSAVAVGDGADFIENQLTGRDVN